MFDAFFELIAGILSAFYAVYPSVGIAIVGLTVVIMVLTAPLTIKSSRSMMAMQVVQPEVKRLQKEHSGDRQALNEAMLALYKEHNINPLSGCLPVLLQLPFFIVMFQVIRGLSSVVRNDAGDIIAGAPKYLDEGSRLFQDLAPANGEIISGGIDLGHTVLQGQSSLLGAAAAWALIAVVAASSYVQQWQMTRRNRARGQEINPQQQMLMRIMPIMFVAFSLTFPLGVVIYMLVSNLFRIGIQEYITKTMAFPEPAGAKGRSRDNGRKGSKDTKKGRQGIVETSSREADGSGNGGGAEQPAAVPRAGTPHPRSKKKKRKKKRR